MSRELTVLVLGNGGREHALALALHRDPSVVALHCAPGNPGTAAIATNHAVDEYQGRSTVRKRNCSLKWFRLPCSGEPFTMRRHPGSAAACASTAW